MHGMAHGGQDSKRRPGARTCLLLAGLAAIAAVPVLAEGTADQAALRAPVRDVRVVLDDGSHILGQGPVRVERGVVVFRLDVGELVSLPFRRVDMVVPAVRTRTVAPSRDAPSEPARLDDEKPAQGTMPATAPWASTATVVISNADLPALDRVPYLAHSKSGEERIDDVYLRIRARRLLDELQVAETRIRESRRQVEVLLQFAADLMHDGGLPVQLDDAITTARLSLESAETYKKDVEGRWVMLQEEARTSGAVLGRLR